MPFAALLLVLATLLPLLACLLLLILGKRMGTPLAGYIATSFIAVSFLCSGWGLLRWIGGGNYNGQEFGKNGAPIDLTWKAIPIGSPQMTHGFEQDHPGWLDLGIYVDSLTVALFVTITLSAMLIHIYAVRSLRRDPAFSRFFTCLQLACFATLTLILSGTLLQMTLALEAVGLAASLLVAFRADRELASRAAGRLFVVNRIGDIALIVGLGMIVCQVGNLSLPDLWLMLGAAGSGSRVVLPGGIVFPTASLTVIGVLLFFGAATRCAQFPFHIWAGDIAEGVAPAAATVFAITVSLGGIFFIARLYPLFTPSARLLIAMVGATTLVMAALMAAVQSDVKKVLAYAAVSQLGYMVLALGVGSWVGGMFHLVAFGFFMVLLFLAAGAVIRASRGETRLIKFGGLLLKMPVTAVTSAVAVAAICGVGWGSVGLSGFFSRGEILRQAGAFAAMATRLHRSGAYWALFALPVLGALLTAFSMTRWWVLTFVGRPRDQRLFDHAREVSTLYWPMVILAILTALAGNWLGVRDMFESSILESRQAVEIQALSGQNYHSAIVHAFDAVWPTSNLSDDEDREDESAESSTETSVALARGNGLFVRWVWPCVLIGAIGGIVIYLPGFALAERLTARRPIKWIYMWLVNAMYFDDLYDALLVNVVRGLASSVEWIDRAVATAPSMMFGRLMPGTSRSAETDIAGRKSQI